MLYYGYKSMRYCSGCGENIWDYKVIEGYVIATCVLCGYEVEFLSKQLKTKLNKRERMPYYWLNIFPQ
jgi:Zn ribbon nucleic-acid-binding protein